MYRYTEEVVSSVTASGGMVVSTADSTRAPDPAASLEAVESVEQGVTSIVDSTPPTLVPTVGDCTAVVSSLPIELEKAPWFQPLNT